MKQIEEMREVTEEDFQANFDNYMDLVQRKENSSRGSRRRLLVRLRYRSSPREGNLRVRVREY